MITRLSTHPMFLMQINQFCIDVELPGDSSTNLMNSYLQDHPGRFINHSCEPNARVEKVEYHAAIDDVVINGVFKKSSHNERYVMKKTKTVLGIYAISNISEGYVFLHMHACTQCVQVEAWTHS